MVEDEKIKTTVSPFAIREGEIKKFDGKDGYVTITQILDRINDNYITDIHFKILELVNQFEFITSRQLFQILTSRGVEVKSQDKLNNKLEQLVKTKILTRYYFTSEEGKCIYRIYCLEKMGKYLLNSNEIDCKWQPTDNAKPVSMIKKRLSGNQAIIAYMRKTKAFDHYVVKPVINGKMTGKVVKANGEVVLSKAGKSISLVFEAVRRESDWQNKFVERLRVYHDFYENFVPLDSGYQIQPQLIFLCEDDKHMVETFKEIITNKLELPNIKMYFTTDLKQNSSTLDKTLVEFVLDKETKKYKANNVVIKLLG